MTSQMSPAHVKTLAARQGITNVLSLGSASHLHGFVMVMLTVGWEMTQMKENNAVTHFILYFNKL